MKFRTSQEISKEIELLKKIKHKVPAKDYFGESNVEKIEAQIKVLSELLTDDDIEDCHFPDSVRESAMYAYEWLAGESNESLYEDWLPLVLSNKDT